jgi:hypothetical protein
VSEIGGVAAQDPQSLPPRQPHDRDVVVERNGGVRMDQAAGFLRFWVSTSSASTPPVCPEAELLRLRPFEGMILPVSLKSGRVTSGWMRAGRNPAMDGVVVELVVRRHR